MSARERLERQREYDDAAEERRESKRELRGRGMVRLEEEEEALQWLLDLSRRLHRSERARARASERERERERERDFILGKVLVKVLVCVTALGALYNGPL